VSDDVEEEARAYFAALDEAYDRFGYSTAPLSNSDAEYDDDINAIPDCTCAICNAARRKLAARHLPVASVRHGGRSAGRIRLLPPTQAIRVLVVLLLAHALVRSWLGW